MSTTVNVEVVWYIFFEYPEDIQIWSSLLCHFCFKTWKTITIIIFWGGGINNYLDELLS